MGVVFSKIRGYHDSRSLWYQHAVAGLRPVTGRVQTGWLVVAGFLVGIRV